jgi:hypothetical protein
LWVDIPNILESSDNEGENENNDEEITDEVELSTNFHEIPFSHKLSQFVTSFVVSEKIISFVQFGHASIH